LTLLAFSKALMTVALAEKESCVITLKVTGPLGAHPARKNVKMVAKKQIRFIGIPCKLCLTRPSHLPKKRGTYSPLPVH
jgi:hypothetical protein